MLSEVSLMGDLGAGEKLANGELVRIDDDGECECFNAGLAGERSRGGGSCLVAGITGDAEK